MHSVFIFTRKKVGLRNYTWHTNRGAYDKIIFDDVRNNAILTAILIYMASKDPDKTSTEKIVLPISTRTGKQMKWPKQRSPTRKGGMQSNSQKNKNPDETSSGFLFL